MTAPDGKMHRKGLSKSLVLQQLESKLKGDSELKYDQVDEKMHRKGLSKSLVLQQLESKLKEDSTYDSGKILSTMCTKPSDFAIQIYMKCIEKNLGDPGLFPGVAKLEKEAIRSIGLMLSNPNARGFFVSGGTEANIMALWAARNLCKEDRNEVIIPTEVHFSFDRAADLLGLKTIRVNLNERYQLDVAEVKKAINCKTLAIVGIVGSTGLGVVDPIAELSEIAITNDLYLHVDAAFGGFVLPFFDQLGYEHIDFDFRLPGVYSITIDPHKMGLAPVPAGGIVFRNDSTMNGICIEVSYLPSLDAHPTRQFTLIGTRPGAPAATVWALLKHLGMEGYARVVKRCMNTTQKLVEGIERIDGVSLVTQPTMNIVGIKPNGINKDLLIQKLQKKGWSLSIFPNYLRIVVMPHVKVSHIQNFLEDLEKTVKELK